MLTLTIPQLTSIFNTLYDREMTVIKPWETEPEAMLAHAQLVTEVQTQLLLGGFTPIVKLKLIKRFGLLPDDIIVGGTNAWQTL